METRWLNVEHMGSGSVCGSGFYMLVVLIPPLGYTVNQLESKVTHLGLCCFVLLKFPSNLQVNNEAHDRSLISCDVALLLDTRPVIIQTREAKDFPSVHTVHSRTACLFVSHQQHLTTTSLWSDTLMQSEVSAEQQAQR